MTASGRFVGIAAIAAAAALSISAGASAKLRAAAQPLPVRIKHVLGINGSSHNYLVPLTNAIKILTPDVGDRPSPAALRKAAPYLDRVAGDLNRGAPAQRLHSYAILCVKLQT